MPKLKKKHHKQLRDRRAVEAVRYSPKEMQRIYDAAYKCDLSKSQFIRSASIVVAGWIDVAEEAKKFISKS